MANPVLKFQPLYTEWAILLPDAEWLAHADQLCVTDFRSISVPLKIPFRVRINQPFNYYIFFSPELITPFKHLFLSSPQYFLIFLRLLTFRSKIPNILKQQIFNTQL